MVTPVLQVALESQEQRVREDPQEPRGRRELKDLPGLLKYLTYWGTKENQASKVQTALHLEPEHQS